VKPVFAFVEGWWPWALAAAVVYAWTKCGSPFPTTPDALFGTAATVASVLAIFLGVSKAIVLSIKSSPTYAILEKHGYTGTLFSFLRAGVFCSIIFSAFSILGFFVSHTLIWHGVDIYKLFCLMWVFMGAASFFSYIRISNILFKLLSVA
jgi:hypothetical protein